MKNILLTTLGYTRDLTDMAYFHFRKHDGELTYCTGISVAEPGTKYMLASHPIDEIIVLGSPDAISEKDVTSAEPLVAMTLPSASELADFSEYGFYCYRLLQYLEGLDIEANEIRESLTKEEQEEALQTLESFNRRFRPGSRLKDLFWQLDMDKACEPELAALRDSITPKQWQWMKYSGYLMMDSYYKMHLLSSNRNVSVRFIPVRKDIHGAFDVLHLNSLVSPLLQDSCPDINFYMDLQGSDFCDGYAFFNVISMLQESTGHRIRIAGVIQSTVTPERLSAPILDEWSRLEMHELLTGLNVFLNYGKADYIQHYWNTHRLQSPCCKRMITGMKYIEEGVSLCNIPVLEYGISSLHTLFSENPPERSRELTYTILAGAIRKDYGKLLDTRETNVPELLKWALRKRMYQQALTIVESQVPADMAKRGIFYYAKTAAEAERVMAAVNVHYWNDNAKNRFAYNDIAHYLIKNYPYLFIDRIQPKDKKNRDMAALHVKRLHGGTEALPAYSGLQNDDLLYDLIYSYYCLSKIRNEVCHAEPPMSSTNDTDTVPAPKACETLDAALARFAKLYDAASAETALVKERPYIISQEEFRGYASRHKLLPLDENENGVLEQNVSCEFNGRDVSIRIRMYEPDPEEPD